MRFSSFNAWGRGFLKFGHMVGKTECDLKDLLSRAEATKAVVIEEGKEKR